MSKKKLSYWARGLLIGLLVGILIPTIVYLTVNLLHPELNYANGSWQCHGLEKSPVSCSYDKFISNFFAFWLAYNLFLFVPSFIVSMVVSSIIVFIIYLVKKRLDKKRRTIPPKP